MENEAKRESKGKAFVGYALKRINGGGEGRKPDTGFAAALQRADNPATEYQSWEYLAAWCDLARESEKAPFATIASALAQAKPVSDGFLGMGKAIAACYTDEGQHNGNDKDAAKAKLRRLLACATSVEACTVLRALLRLIASRGVAICYGQLLDDLLWANSFDRTKIRWAQDFYGRKEEP